MKTSLPSDVEAEFLRIPDAVRFSGIGRTTLYELIKSGQLKSKCIWQRGAATGIRLISRQAIRDFINSCGDGTEENQRVNPVRPPDPGKESARPVGPERALPAHAGSAAPIVGLEVPVPPGIKPVRAPAGLNITAGPAGEEEPAAPLLTPKTARRMAEIDRVINIMPGQGVAETVLSNILTDMRDGDVSMVMSAWDLDDPEESEALLHGLAEKWNSEDAAPATENKAPAV